MATESILNKFKRIVIKADLRADDEIPMIGKLYSGGDLRLINLGKLSQTGLVIRYALFVLVLGLASLTTFTWIMAIFDPTIFSEVGILIIIVFLIIELILLVQALSIISYVRWRFKHRHITEEKTVNKINSKKPTSSKRRKS